MSIISKYRFFAVLTALAVFCCRSTLATSVLTISPEAILELPEESSLQIYLFLENCTDPQERIDVKLVQVKGELKVDARWRDFVFGAASRG